MIRSASRGDWEMFSRDKGGDLRKALAGPGKKGQKKSKGHLTAQVDWGVQSPRSREDDLSRGRLPERQKDVGRERDRRPY